MHYHEVSNCTLIRPQVLPLVTWSEKKVTWVWNGYYGHLLRKWCDAIASMMSSTNIFICKGTFGKSILQVPDTGTWVLDNTRQFLRSSIVSFWMTPTHSKER